MPTDFAALLEKLIVANEALAAHPDVDHIAHGLGGLDEQLSTTIRDALSSFKKDADNLNSPLFCRMPRMRRNAFLWSINEIIRHGVVRNIEKLRACWDAILDEPQWDPAGELACADDNQGPSVKVTSSTTWRMSTRPIPSELLRRMLTYTHGEPVVDEQPIQDCPSWDAARRTLTFRGAAYTIKHNSGSRVEAIFREFAEANWPPRIESPLPGNVQISSVLQSINKAMKRCGVPLHFKGDGTRSIVWEMLACNDMQLNSQN